MFELECLVWLGFGLVTLVMVIVCFCLTWFNLAIFHVVRFGFVCFGLVEFESGTWFRLNLQLGLVWLGLVLLL